MKLIYINDELATGDGSNSHAVGMLHSFNKILGKENVKSFPRAEDGSEKPVNLKVGSLKIKLRGPLQIVRFFRKKLLSIKRSKAIITELKADGFVPTHVIARSTVFDITAIYVAKAFNAKLVYEINTPMFYERGVIQKEPMIRAIEKWEKQIIDASDYIYIVSSVCRDMLCERYGCSKDKFLVIPNGYMAELYTETDKERKKIRDEVRENKKISDKFVITFVGSLKVWHGIKTFCEVAERMEDNNDVRFLVLGDGDMHDLISDYANNHNNMIFKGKVNLETMKRYLYASDIGIMPYDNQENFYYSPLKMFDMIGAGLPFLGTDVGQIHEYVNTYLCDDFLVENNLTDTILDKIEDLKNSSDKIEKMEQLVKTQQKQCTWSKRAEELIACIR